MQRSLIGFFFRRFFVEKKKKNWLIWIGDGNDIGYTALRFILFWNAAALASHLPPSTNLARLLFEGG